MSYPAYEDKGPIDCPVDLDLSSIKGKSVIVTGGANGLGQAYVRAFAKAGAFVTIGDVEEAAGDKLASEYPGNAQFVKCDVTSWEDQLHTFKSAIAASPSHSCDIVIANAGIGGPDPIMTREDTPEPTKPSLAITSVNLTGILYTTKLALHYFRLQPTTDPARDRCLILQGSLAGYCGQPGSAQYCASKFGIRGLMASLRVSAAREGIRTNIIAPSFIRTRIISAAADTVLRSHGIEYASADDAAKAALRIASDPGVNGRSLGVVPRSEVANGYFDLAHDDYPAGDLMHAWQKTASGL